MKGWVNHSQDQNLPSWLKDNLASECPHCKSPMLNYYNVDNRCTDRKCSNNSCYGFVAARADFARKIVGIKDIGYAGCLRDAIMYKCKSPFELFKVWNFVPTVTVDQFLRIHCFKGIDSEWEKIVQTLGIYTLDELYNKYDGKWKSLLEENKDEIYGNAKYVVFKQKPDGLTTKGVRHTYTIMITGTPKGFNTKEDFISAINYACRGLITVLHQKTKRQSGVDFLIREHGSTTRGKVEAAIKGGIPIVTSQEFVAFLVNKIESLNSEQ